MGREFKKSKYTKQHEEHIKGIEKLTKKAEKYKPKPLKISEAKPLTSDDLPDRPSAPKMPTIKMPGGVLKSDRVANPSGRSGSQLKYKAQTRSGSSVARTYKDAPTGGAGKLAKFKRKVKGK